VALFRTILVTVALVLAVLLAAALLIFLVTLAFLGLGTLFSHFFELTLFEATMLTLLGTVALMLLVHLIRTLFFSATDEGCEEWDEDEEEEGDWYDEDWDEDDWEEDWDEEDQSTGISFLRGLSTRRTEQEEDIFAGVGRNDPCPCGSGKKFKYCHGRSRGR